MVRVPRPEEEDAEHIHRERENLVQERLRIEIEALLFMQRIRKGPSGEGFWYGWSSLRLSAICVIERSEPDVLLDQRATHSRASNKNTIRTVILVSHWSRYFEGFRLRDSSMESLNPILTKSFQEDVVALNSTIRAFAARERSVVLIGPAPESMIDGYRLHYLRARGFSTEDVAQAPPEALRRMKLTRTYLKIARWSRSAINVG